MVDAWASEQDDASSVELGDDYNLPMPDYMMLKAAPEYSAIEEFGPSSEQTVQRGDRILNHNSNDDNRPSFSSYDSSCVLLPRTSKLPFDPNVSDLLGLRQSRSHQSIAFSNAKMKDIAESPTPNPDSGVNIKDTRRPQLSIVIDGSNQMKRLTGDHNVEHIERNVDARDNPVEEAPMRSSESHVKRRATPTLESVADTTVTTEPNTSTKSSFSNGLPYPITPAIFDALTSVMDAPFTAQFSKTKKDNKGRPVMTAASIPRIIAQITSEKFMDYDLLSDFFLTFRSYLSPEDLALLLFARLEWALMRRGAEGKIILIRVFAALRHWVLNYFVEDFIVNYTLRVLYCNRLNALHAALRKREAAENTSFASDIKVLVDLKRCWVGQCTLFYDIHSSLPREQDVFFEPDQEIGPIAQPDVERSRSFMRYSDLRTPNNGVFALVRPSTTQNTPAVSPTAKTREITPVFPPTHSHLSSESSGSIHATGCDGLEKRRGSVTAPRITSNGGYSHKQCGSYSNSLRSSLGTLEEKDKSPRQRFSGIKGNGKTTDDSPSSPKKPGQKRSLAPSLARLQHTNRHGAPSTTPTEADIAHSPTEGSLPNTPHHSPITPDDFHPSRAMSGDLLSNKKSNPTSYVGVRRMSSLPNPRLITPSGPSGASNTADAHLTQLSGAHEQEKLGASATGKPKVKQLIETFKWRPFKEKRSDRNLGSLDRLPWHPQQQAPAKNLERMRSRSRSQSANRLSRDDNVATGPGNLFKFRSRSGGGSGWRSRFPSMTQNNSKQNHETVDILGEYAALAYWKHVNPAILNMMAGPRPLSHSIIPTMGAPQPSDLSAANSQHVNELSDEMRMREPRAHPPTDERSVVIIDDTSMTLFGEGESGIAPSSLDRQFVENKPMSHSRNGRNNKFNLNVHVPRTRYDEDNQRTPRPLGPDTDTTDLSTVSRQAQQERTLQCPEKPKQWKILSAKVPSAFDISHLEGDSPSSNISNNPNDLPSASNAQQRDKHGESFGRSYSVTKRVKSISSKLRRRSNQANSETNQDTFSTFSSSYSSSKFSYKDQNEPFAWNSAASPQNRRYPHSVSSAFLSQRSGSLDGYQSSPSISTRTDVSSIPDSPKVIDDPGAPRLRRLPGGNLRKARNIHDLKIRPWSLASTVRDTERTYSFVESVMSSNGLAPLSQTITTKPSVSRNGTEDSNHGDIHFNNDRCTLKVNSSESINDAGLESSAKPSLEEMSSKSTKSKPSVLQLQKRPSKPYSLISTHSSQHLIGKTASFEAAVTQFSGIPDDDDGGVESTLLKLEGKWEPKGPESPAEVEHFYPVWDGNTHQRATPRNLDGNPTITVRELSGSFTSGKTESGLSTSARPFLSMASSISGHANIINENPSHSIRSTPSLIQENPSNSEITNNSVSDARSGTSFLDTRDSMVKPPYSADTEQINESQEALEHVPDNATAMEARDGAPTSNAPRVENGNQEKHEHKSMSHNQPNLCFRVQQHVPFILSHKARVLAEQLTLIEQATLNDVDWRDLVEMRWNVSTNDPITLNWAEYVSTSQGNGIDVVITRFNLMVKWVISEVILTSNVQTRARTITKFINIAKHARSLRNFSTTTQIVIALASATCASLTKTWDLVSAKHKRTFGDLEALLHPKGNFVTLRDEMENQILEPQGCIPFLGLYVQDLTFNAQASTHITIDGGSDSTTTTTTSTVQQPVKLVNFERHRTTAEIVKSVLRLIDASTKYDMHTLNGVTERCLWISALPDKQVRELSQNIQLR